MVLTFFVGSPVFGTSSVGNVFLVRQSKTATSIAPRALPHDEIYCRSKDVTARLNHIRRVVDPKSR